MSLINQMLKELDKRSTPETSAGAGFPGEVASVRRPGRRQGVLRAALFAVLLVGIGMAWALWPDRSQTAEKTAGQAATTSLSAASEPAAVSQDPAEIAEQPSAEMENSRSTIENLHLSPTADGLQVEMTFSSGPIYRLIHDDQGKQLALELPDGTGAPSLPDTTGLPLLQKVAYEKGDGKERLVFALNETCRYDELSLAVNPAGEGQTLRFVIRAEPGAVLPATAAEPTVAEPAVEAIAAVQSKAPPREDASDAPEFVRQAIQPTPGERAEKIFQDGITAHQQGRQREAETAWRAALAIDPSHVRSRDALMHLMMQQGRRSEIKSLLAEGVRNVPGHLPYRLRFARLLIEENSLSAAWEELSREPRPSIAEAPDLYAMLATISQRQERYDEAADIYRALVAVRPENGIWWMGFGITLERTASLDQARQAYHQALSRRGLSEGLRDFIRKRLAVLENQGAQEPEAGISGKERS